MLLLFRSWAPEGGCTNCNFLHVLIYQVCFSPLCTALYSGKKKETFVQLSILHKPAH